MSSGIFVWTSAVSVLIHCCTLFEKFCTRLVFFMLSESMLASAEKPQISERALFSNVYLWDFNSGHYLYILIVYLHSENIACKLGFNSITTDFFFSFSVKSSVKFNVQVASPEMKPSNQHISVMGQEVKKMS